MVKFLDWLFGKKKTEAPVFVFDKPSRKIRRVFIHCSASDNPSHDDISVIRKWHTTKDKNDPSKPWSDVGYHYFIKKDGTIQAGRPLNRAPAAQGGHNKATIAICCAGLKKESFTQMQFDSLKSLCVAINTVYEGDVTFHGHCEVSSKLCPVFDYKAVLNLAGNGRMLID